jgi:hypothetical protein
VILWLAYLQIGVALGAGVLCVIAGLAGRKPADLTMGATVAVEALLLGQLVVTIAVTAMGYRPTGSLLEFFVYLITAILLPPLAIFWGLIERTRWSTVVLGVTCLAVAVMLYRMHQIWFIQVA